MESRFVGRVDGGLQCTICPHLCVLGEGGRGRCGTKERRGDKIMDLSYGRITALAFDPIEKKPLAHFHPGSVTLSISSVGCNFSCPWCQNYELSTASVDAVHTRHMEPEEVVGIALTQECDIISYTYNEPLINLNYVEDTARFAHESGLKNVLVTNGYTHIPSFAQVVDYIDAANVDWKSFNPEFYTRYCGGQLEKVLEATQFMHDHGVHVEITFLVIPQTNDSPSEAREMAKYIAENLGPDTPLHLSRFFPMYRFTHLPPTPVETLQRSREIAMEEGLRYVYIGNTRGGEGEDTLCPSCGSTVVARRGYAITGWKLDQENRCLNCGEPIPIVGGLHRPRR